MTYYAKSNPEVTVKKHLEEVSKKAKDFGEEIGCPKAAELAGLLHDFGKYSKAFDEVLHGKKQNVDHAICGAAMLYSVTKEKRVYHPLVEAIGAHHDGLIGLEALKPYIKQSLGKNGECTTKPGKTSALNGVEQYKNAMEAFIGDFSQKKFVELIKSAEKPDFSAPIDSMLWTRMLFSCLVDADYSISAADKNPNYLQETEISDGSFPEMLNALIRHRDKIKADSTADGTVNRIRDEVFEACGNAGQANAPGLFTLTAPTGTGKTLALFHFALRHCIHNNLKRIIIVLPYLTLTDQSAATYRSIYGDILEDHSQSRLTDRERELAERWSVPVIITTSVQFFESLFSNQPGDCRKLHSIANSVVVFDEAQSLPLKLTPATLKAVQYLIKRYHTTMLFSTATQPDYAAISEMNWEPIEILPEHARLYETLKRTKTDWRIKERTPLCEIAREMAGRDNVCAIVNLKRHAGSVYQALIEQCDPDEVFYLTTELCPAHRRSVIEKIKQRQRAGLPCRVVATQCIEAGVDLDFDTVFRALAPLEAIVQAAGRCNRNGKHTSGLGEVIVFIPDEPEPLYPGKRGDSWYEIAAQKVESISKRHPIDIHDPAHMKEYYDMLFATTLDRPLESKDLTDAIEGRNYENVSKEYRLIEDNGCRLIVPYPNVDGSISYEQIHSEAVHSGLTKKLIKEAAAITVSVGYAQKEQLAQYAEELKFRGKGTGSNFYVLCPQYYEQYDEKRGVHFMDAISFMA